MTENVEKAETLSARLRRLADSHLQMMASVEPHSQMWEEAARDAKALCESAVILDAAAATVARLTIERDAALGVPDAERELLVDGSHLTCPHDGAAPIAAERSWSDSGWPKGY